MTMKDNSPNEKLTEEETKILGFLISKYTDANTPQKIDFDKDFIEKIKTDLKQKLNTYSDTELIVIAYKKGLIK